MTSLALALLLHAGGSVASNGSVTTFTADTVTSPTVNVSRRTDASWAGVLRGQPIDLDANLRGVNVNLTVERDTTRGKTTVAGLVFQKPFRLVLSPEQLEVRVGNTVEQYVREKDGTWRPQAPSARYSLRLEGDAASANPPLPQLVLAFIANGVAARR